MSQVNEFILAHTKLQTLAFLPEIKLHLADEMEPLWEKLVAETLKEDLPPPFWAFAWIGGQALARYILDNPETVKGKRVLDFACGSGLVGIAAAKAGAKAVLYCDIDPLAQRVCEMNAQANDVPFAHTEIHYLKRPPKGVDLILAGDICYEHLMAHRLLAWLRLCAASGIEVLLGEPGRAYAPQEDIRLMASYTIATSLAVEQEKERKVNVLTLLNPDSQ